MNLGVSSDALPGRLPGVFGGSMNRSFSVLRTKTVRAAALVSGAMLSGAVFAQSVTDPFEAALSTVTTKVTSYAGSLVGLAAVAVVFMVAIKYVKQLPQAS